MDIKDFEAELKLLNKDLSIRPNNASARVLEMFPDVNKLASVLYCGEEICTLPAEGIFDEKNGNYGVDLRSDGRFIAHRSRPEVLDIIKTKLAYLADKDNADAFFGRGEYSEAALRSRTEEKGEVTLVEEVPIDVKPIQGGMIEGAK